MKLGTTSWLIGENFLDNARLVNGQVDFLELLVYTWDTAVQRKVGAWLDGLGAFALEYTLHLPTDTIENALAAAAFFLESGFPLLNMTLHPLPGWQNHQLPSLVALENLVERAEYYPRFTFDLTHSLLGQSVSPAMVAAMVELHLSGTDGRRDHLALDKVTLQKALPYFSSDLLVCCEIFHPDDALAAVDMVRTASGGCCP